MLKIKNMNLKKFIRQGDTQPREYQLDTGNLNLNLANKRATIRLMTDDYKGIAYETTATVSSGNKITFSIDDIIPACEYHLEITVDNYVFPSRALDEQFKVDPSSHGQEVSIIQIVGKDEIVRDVKEQVKIELEPFLGGVEQVELTNYATKVYVDTAVSDVQAPDLSDYVLSSRVLTDVPADAKFTDTTYTAGTGINITGDVISATGGDSSVEVEEARVDASGHTNATLKERLDKEHNEVTAQLAQTIENNAIVLRPSGNADDATLINDAITLVSTSTRFKKVILDGIFPVSIPVAYGEVIMMKSHVILEFTPGSKLVLAPNNYDGYHIILCENIENFEIINPHVVGDAEIHTGTTGDWGHGVRIRGCKNYKIYDLYAEKCWGDGISIGNSPDGTISENGYINRITSYKCRRNGVTIASAKNLTIDYIEGIEINGTNPKAALDIESNTSGEVWDNISIGKVVSRLCPGGVDIFPEAMSKYEYSTNIDIKIDEIEIIGTNHGNTGTFWIDGANPETIKGNIRVGSLSVDKGNRGLYISNVLNGGVVVDIDRVKVITSNTGDTSAIGNRAGVFIEVKAPYQGTKNIGNINIDTIEVLGDAEYSILLIAQLSGIIEKSSLRIARVIKTLKKPMRIEGTIHNLTDNIITEANFNEMAEIYNPGQGWFTHHFLSNLYHNEGATTNKEINPAGGNFNMKNTPIVLENREDGMSFGLRMEDKTIYPISLEFVDGFKTTEKGARIKFIQDDSDDIIVLEKLGNWTSRT